MAAYTLVFDHDAEADLASILAYITEARGRDFAIAFIDRIIAYCEGLAELPHRGTRRDEILPGLRTLGWRRTVTIAFRVDDATRSMAILGVFYRGRDVLGAMQARNG